MFGDVWEWTSSPYVAYPGYEPPPGASRRIQRQVHVQPVRPARRLVRDAGRPHPASYRNFFPPEAQWQFSGVRLARDA